MTIDNASRYATALAILAVLGAAACIAVPAWQLIVSGPFDWHIKQPFTWQGGLEALALAFLVATGCLLHRRWATLALVAVPLAFYLRRHAVDVPLLIDLLYLEIIIGLGALMRRVFRLRAPQDARDYLQAFVLGFLTWSVLAWSASALDVGSIKALRWLTPLLAIPAIGARHTPFALYLWRRLGVQTAMDRFWCGALAAWVAVLYARSNVVFGYDGCGTACVASTFLIRATQRRQLFPCRTAAGDPGRRNCGLQTSRAAAARICSRARLPARFRAVPGQLRFRQRRLVARHTDLRPAFRAQLARYPSAAPGKARIRGTGAHRRISEAGAGRPRAVGYAEEPASFWLPARFEHLLMISYWRSEYVDDPQRFLCFLRDQRIDYLVLPTTDAPKELAKVTPAVRAAVESLGTDPDVRRIYDRNYLLLDLSARHRHDRAYAAPRCPLQPSCAARGS